MRKRKNFICFCSNNIFSLSIKKKQYVRVGAKKYFSSDFTCKKKKNYHFMYFSLEGDQKKQKFF